MKKLQNDKYNRLYKRKRVTLHASPKNINLLHMHDILVYYYVVGAIVFLFIVHNIPFTFQIFLFIIVHNTSFTFQTSNLKLKMGETAKR